MNNQKYDETKRKNSDSKRFEEALESEAEGLETSTDALRLYALAQEKATKSTKNLSAATAKNAAASYKFNKAYNEGRKAFTDNKEAWDTYVKAIKSGEEISYDVADAAGEIVKSLREMGINLSNEQLQDPEALKQIKTLFSGTEAEAKKAYEVLRDMSWLHDLVNNLGMAEDKAKSFIATLKSTDLNNPIDTTKLQESFGNTQKTLEEWKAWAEQYGINIEVKEPTTEITEAELTHPERVSKHVIAAHKDGEGNDIAEYSYTETEYVAPEKVYGVGDLKFTKVSNGGGNFKPASTGGGSKSKPKKEDKIDEKKDRYHDINIELKQIANELQKVQDEQDNLVGSDLIANLQRQYNLLNKEIDKTAEKIGIARDEQNELQGILSGNGIKFNADGTIANYAEAWDAELAHVNSIIDKYNSLSTADAQEKYQETLDKAKERWNKFKEDMSRYDTLVTEEIPELESNIRTALDKQIEIKLEAFEYEIQIRLDMSEAERDWNEFKKKVIDGIKDDDILGNAKSKLKDFSTYYNAQGTGEIDATTTHVNKILQQLYQMDADQAAGAYGETYSYTNAQGELVTIDYNNRKQALDDLKEYYTQLMDSMTNLQELSEEIHQSYLDMMDETQEKFNEQLDTYGKLSDMISHDMNLTSLIFGEDSYSLLADFYKKQKENSLEQLDFQRKQVDFWRAQMDAAEEGSEE